MEALPATIETLEAEQAGINAALADGNLFRDDLSHAKSLQKRLDEIGESIETALSRWEELENRN